MTRFAGKKLLILGSNTLSCEAVDYAQKHGAYTVVTDYLPIEKSPAKLIADEALFISTADTAGIVEYCRRNSIDGVFAGISEFNLIQAQNISEKLGLRFYFDKNQWDLLEHKNRFKTLCCQFNIPTPMQWFSGSESEFALFDRDTLTFPVVVKPVDGSASQGVSICTDRAELLNAVSSAFKVSAAGRIIIEAYIIGHEFTAHYTISHGQAALACIDNRYSLALHEGRVTTIPIARVYPALFYEQFIRTLNPKLTAMCESIGLDTAIIFVQGLYDEMNDAFFIFEAGLRSAAEAPCRFLERISGQNQFYMLIDYILLGRTGFDLCREDPAMDHKCCAVVSFASTGGTVTNIRGIDYVRSIPEVIQIETRYPVGSIVPAGDTLRQIVMRFVIMTESREALARVIDQINNAVHMTDEHGNEMLIGMESTRVFGLE